MAGTVVVTTKLPEETEAFAERFAKDLKPGDVIGLIGELGTGKTCFVRGMARAVGSSSAVKSPSFTVLNVYAGGSIELYHMDLFRLNKPEDLHGAGLEEYIYGKGVSVIEWADKSEGLTEECGVIVKFTNLGDNKREIMVSWRD